MLGTNHAGLTIPLIVSATATFLFRQFFLTIPDELAEARALTAPGRCALWDVVIPLSRQHRRALRHRSSTAGTSTCGRCW
jgi:sn-glycerol 3-phosphate transport system permease protein